MKPSKTFRTLLSIALLGGALTGLVGCDKSVNLDPVNPAWDRDTCTRCNMLISDHHFTAQIVNPQTGDHFSFDDLGCALDWLNKTHPTWAKDALIYATDAQGEGWVNIQKGVIATPFVTPMSFGLGVVASADKLPTDKKVVTLEEAQALVAEKIQSKAHHHAMGH